MLVDLGPHLKLHWLPDSKLQMAWNLQAWTPTTNCRLWSQGPVVSLVPWLLQASQEPPQNTPPVESAQKGSTTRVQIGVAWADFHRKHWALIPNKKHHRLVKDRLWLYLPREFVRCACVHGLLRTFGLSFHSECTFYEFIIDSKMTIVFWNLMRSLFHLCLVIQINQHISGRFHLSSKCWIGALRVLRFQADPWKTWWLIPPTSIGFEALDMKLQPSLCQPRCLDVQCCNAFVTLLPQARCVDMEKSGQAESSHLLIESLRRP